MHAGAAGAESAGEVRERATGLSDACLSGVHLRLPGHGDDGPTLEIFSYGRNRLLGPGMPHRTGYGHIAFIVPDVPAAQAAVQAAGARPTER